MRAHSKGELEEIFCESDAETQAKKRISASIPRFISKGCNLHSLVTLLLIPTVELLLLLLSD